MNSSSGDVVLLTHTAGTIGGATAAVSFAALDTVHAGLVSEVIIAAASAAGLFIALLSYWTGRKNDPKQALINHAAQDVERFNALDAKVELLVEHLISPVASAHRKV